jgi:hypothetical protein
MSRRRIEVVLEATMPDAENLRKLAAKRGQALKKRAAFAAAAKGKAKYEAMAAARLARKQMKRAQRKARKAAMVAALKSGASKVDE